NVQPTNLPRFIPHFGKPQQTPRFNP
ncbi:hypothetical protein BV073_00987B, partial [Haemophilus influenzae]